MPIPFVSLIPLIGSALGAGAGIAGHAMNRSQSQRDIDRQNQYNSPINQLARLRQAGLPFAAMEGGHAGSQSALPQTSGEGISNSIQNYIATSSQLLQMKLIKAQIAKTEEEAYGEGLRNQIYETDPFAGEPVSYGARLARLDVETKMIEKNMREYSRDIQALDYKVKKELTDDSTISNITRAQLTTLLRSIKLADMKINEGEALQTIINGMKRNGMSMWEAILMAFAQSQIGGASINFPSIHVGR